jgi:hypothetical protein
VLGVRRNKGRGKGRQSMGCRKGRHARAEREGGGLADESRWLGGRG